VLTVRIGSGYEYVEYRGILAYRYVQLDTLNTPMLRYVIVMIQLKIYKIAPNINTRNYN
jgi:hypothetical protein